MNNARNTTAKYAQMIKNLQKLHESVIKVVNKYCYYKFSYAIRQKKLNTIRDNEFDVGYSGLSMPIDSNFYLPAGKKKLYDITNTIERYAENIKVNLMV